MSFNRGDNYPDAGGDGPDYEAQDRQARASRLRSLADDIEQFFANGEAGRTLVVALLRENAGDPDLERLERLTEAASMGELALPDYLGEVRDEIAGLRLRAKSLAPSAS